MIEWCKWLLQLLKNESNGALPYQERKESPIHVLVNGPSLSTTIGFLDKKPGKVMMVNNALCKSFSIYPDYYCIVDPIYGDENFNGTKALYRALEEYRQPLVVYTISEISNKMHLNNSKIDIRNVCCNTCPEYRGKREEYILKKNLASFLPQGVVVMALYVSIQLGYKTIYLHGADASEIYGIRVDDKNRLLLKPNHYYEEDNKEIWLKNHNMLKEYIADCNLYESLYGLKKYSEDCGANIINLSVNSLIDCFEKLDISNVLG